MLTVPRSTNFGSAKGGLATVGYTLINIDGTTHRARTTAGVTELVASKGIYGASIDFEDQWIGVVVWDTGGVTPLYTVDQFDFRAFTPVAPIYSASPIVKMVDYKPEFKRLAKLLGQVLQAMDRLPDANLAVSKGIIPVIEGLKAAETGILEAVRTENPVIGEIREGVRVVGEALEAIIESQEFDKQLKEIGDAQNLG